jgi:hypothetical protein
VTSFPELLGVGRRLDRDTSASTTFTVGRAGAVSFIYASAATVAATSETATAEPTVFGDFMGAPLLPARGTVARRNGLIQYRGGRVFDRPSGPQDRTLPAKLEIPFGHAFDKRGVSLPKSAVRVRPVDPGRETHRVTAAALEAHGQHARNAWR